MVEEALLEDLLVEACPVEACSHREPDVVLERLVGGCAPVAIRIEALVEDEALIELLAIEIDPVALDFDGPEACV